MQVNSHRNRNRDDNVIMAPVLNKRYHLTIKRYCVRANSSTQPAGRHPMGGGRPGAGSGSQAGHPGGAGGQLPERVTHHFVLEQDLLLVCIEHSEGVSQMSNSVQFALFT